MSVRADEMILASVDDHICEPADMFVAHVPAKYRDQMPRVVDEPDGSQQWYYGEIRGRNLGLNAVAGTTQRATRRCDRVATTCTSACGTCPRAASSQG